MLDPSTSGCRSLLTLLALVIIARLALSTYLPVTEFSEARYAEISRRILANWDWITLWFDDGRPFWGKPPLAFWSIASSYLILGVSGFAARVPSLVCVLATGALLFWWSERSLGASVARRVLVCYATSIVVLHAAGSVLTDPLLLLTTTVVMITFWEALQHGNRRAALLMWMALGFGMLAKGPIAPVLCGIACGTWVVLHRQWRALFSRAYMFRGLLLMTLVSAPWYYLAELKTPGFLNYFIIGEHFERYTQSEWRGDPYGSVKDRPPGTIWLYFLLASLPWSLLVVGGLLRREVRARLTNEHLHNDLSRYLLIWIMTPLVFFTPAKNVLITYVLPSLPAFALLFALGSKDLARRALLTAAYISTTAFFVASILLYLLYFESHRYNQEPMVSRYLEMN